MQDLFDQPLAIDPNGNDGEGAIVADAEFQVFLPDDLSFATPLAVTDPVSGLPITPLRSSSIGQLPQFRVEGDPESVILKSGSYAVRVLSPLGIAKLAVDLAGLSPAVVQQAIAAVDTTAASAATALAQANLAAEHAADSDESREAAVSARADAIAARDAAQAVGATTDAIVAPILSSSSTASGAALRATMGEQIAEAGAPARVATDARIAALAEPAWRVAAGARVLAHGTSISHGDDTVTQPRNSPLTHAMLHSDGRWRRVANTSVDGTTSATHLATLEAALIAHKPSVVVLDPVPNDRSSSIPAATTVQNLDAMVKLAGRYGVKVVVCNGTPDSTQLSNSSRTNAAVERYCSRNGLPVVNWHGVMVDPTTGGLKAIDKGAPNNDNTHPNYAGRQPMGWELARVLDSVIPTNPGPLFDYAADPRNLLGAAGFFSGALNGYAPAGLTDAWTLQAGTASEVTFEAVTVAGVPGKMMQVTSAAGGGANIQIFKDITTGWSVGDVLDFTGIYRTLNAPQLQSPAALIQFRDAGNAIIAGSEQPEGFAYTGGMRGAVERGVWARQLPPIPAGTARVHVRLRYSSGAGNYVGAFGAIGVRNLTVEGLVDA